VRAGGFDITAASEIMAILALADGPDDLRARLGRIVIGRTVDGRAATAADVGAVGSMMALLRDAMLPNLVATHEGTPAIVHCGPFANIAHGTASVVAMKAGLHLAEVAVVECGFGFDLGGEKFFDLVARGGPLSPAAVVIIASLRALRLHGGVAPDRVATPDLAAVQAGLPNLLRHLDNARLFGRPVVIALNAFAGDSAEEVAAVRAAVTAADAGFAVIDAPARGADGGVELAQLVLDTLAAHPKAAAGTVYPADASLRTKLELVATKIYRATQVVLSDEATAQLADLEAAGWGHLPVCMAKTPASFTDDPTRPGAPDGHTLTVRRFELAAGAGFIVALCGAIVRMPGLPKQPRAFDIDLGRRRDRRRRLTAIDRAIGHAAQARRRGGDAASAIATRRSIRSGIGGCVENQLATELDDSGAQMKRLAVAGESPTVCSGTRALPRSSLASALARPSGSPEMRAPNASAPYSREREIARRMRVAAIGATMMSASVPRSPGPSRSSRAPPKASAPHCTAVAMNDTTEASMAAIDAIKMSRLWMWASSWAITPRSSRSVRSARRPVVTATTPWRGSRPVAKALGAGSSMT
jgi:hypothetical protein